MTETKASTSSLAKNGAVMAAGSLVSRITGFLRNVVMGAALGTAVGNAYTTAQYFPQMIYELVLGGTLTSVLVPLIVRARNRDADQGEAFTQRLLTLAVVVLAAATACVVAAAPLMSGLMAEPYNRDLVTQLSYLMLPAIFFYGLSALFQAVLNTRDHFFAPMWAPILNNIVVIVVGGSFFVLYAADLAAGHKLAVADVTTPMVLLLGAGTTCGLLVQSASLWPALRKVGFRWKWRFDFRKLHLGEIGRLAGWILCYVAVSQVAVIVVVKIANILSHDDRYPGPIIYNNAYLVTMMAHGIVAVSVITAMMPRLSAAAGERRFADLADGLSSGTRLSTLILMPITVVYVVLGTQLGIVMFAWGTYNVDDASATGLVIAMGGLALIPFAISQLQTFAFYALTDGRTVALINIPVVVLRIAGYVFVLAVVDPRYGVAGLMVANGVSYVLAVVLSTMMLRRRVGLLGMRQVVRTWIRQFVAGLVAAGVAWPLLTMLPGPESGKAVLIGELAGVGLVAVAVYFLVAYLLRVPEITDMTRMVRSKLGR